MGSGAAHGRRVILRAVLVFLLSAKLASASCETGRADLRGDWGQVRFSVEVADSASERSQGLMNRPSLPRSAGMLFVYERPQTVSFWMRNTLIPLDMIFMDANGVVKRVHENAIPLDETGIMGGSDIQFVLEINGGLARRLGIVPGSELRHPAIGPDAAWPCSQ